MAGPKDLHQVEKVCFYCSSRVPDNISLALHYVKQHWEEVRRRQGQTYRPKPESRKASNIIFPPQPTSGQGGSVRRVSVMSADDERRMAVRKEMLAAKRAQMPPQKVKLVYNRNKSNTVNKEEVRNKIAKLSADVINEELQKRQQMNMKIPTGEGVVKDIVKEACDGVEASKKWGTPGEKGINNSQVSIGDGELIKVVGKVVGVGNGERQEFEFDEEVIEVEDELLGVDQGSDIGKVVGDDIVKESSGEGEQSNPGATMEKQGMQTECRPEVAERSVSPIIMSRGKKARLSSPSSTPSKAASPSSTPSKAASPSSTPSKAISLSSTPSKAASPSSTPSKVTSPGSTPSKAASRSSTPTTYGFDTPSPSLERKSRVLASLIMSDERKAGPEEEKTLSRGVTEKAQEKIGDALGDLGKPRHCEVRLVKLDKVHLLKASQGPGSGGDGGLISCDIEGANDKKFEMATKRCDVKLAKLDKHLLSTKLPSVENGGKIDQAKVVEVVDLSGDQDRTTTKKKSCVVRLAKLTMHDDIIKAMEKEIDVKMIDAEKKMSD